MVRGGNNDKEVTRQRYGKGACKANPLVDFESPEQEEKSTEVEQEYKERRMMPPCPESEEPFERTENFIHREAAVSPNLIVGHTREHGAGPERVITRSFMVFHTLMHRSRTPYTVTREDDFSLQRWPKIHRCGNNKKEQNE